jgi:ribonuclease Z
VSTRAASDASIRVVFLGTGNAVNVERFQSSILVETRGLRVLFDTGGGLELVSRLARAGVEPASVGHIVLSHRHLDHIGGLEPFLLTVGVAAFGRGEPPAPIRVYATGETASAVRTVLGVLNASGAILLCADRLTWVTPPTGEAVSLGDGVTLTLVPVDHLPPGGGAAGCVIDIGGRRIVYSGDTRPSAELTEAARDADLLIHEVAGLDENAKRVHVPGHATAGEAGRIAAAAGVHTLALTHIPPSGTVALADLVAEARQFAGAARVVAGEDGLALEI